MAVRIRYGDSYYTAVTAYIWPPSPGITPAHLDHSITITNIHPLAWSPHSASLDHRTSSHSLTLVYCALIRYSAHETPGTGICISHNPNERCYRTYCRIMRHSAVHKNRRGDSPRMPIDRVVLPGGIHWDTPSEYAVSKQTRIWMRGALKMARLGVLFFISYHVLRWLIL